MKSVSCHSLTLQHQIKRNSKVCLTISTLKSLDPYFSSNNAGLTVKGMVISTPISKLAIPSQEEIPTWLWVSFCTASILASSSIANFLWMLKSTLLSKLTKSTVIKRAFGVHFRYFYLNLVFIILFSQ